MRNPVKVVNLGRMGFQQALQKQICYQKKHLQGKNEDKKDADVDTLLIVEHEPVYTIGIRTKGYTPADKKRLTELGADYYATNRGGLITFHGPGQLVAYPILNLKHFNIGMKDYICCLERTVINTCEQFDIVAGLTKDVGVWVGNSKISAIGVRGSRYITSHGLALNCNVDLSWFNHIIPCGIENKGVTSLSNELARDVTIEETLPTFLDCFSTEFKCSFIK